MFATLIPINPTSVHATTMTNETTDLAQEAAPPLYETFGDVLKADGTLNLAKAEGASFSNLDGWQMTLGPDGAPRFAQPAADNANWDDQFGFPGSRFQIVSLAAGGGNVYAGLFFGGEVGYLDVEGIARWDGCRWHAMGAGLDEPPSDILVKGTDVYVVGAFESAGGKGIGGIARWDTTNGTWNAVGSGVGPRDTVDSPEASAIAALGNDIYIGGEFVEVDGVEALTLARWDGTNWSAVGGGVERQDTGNLGEVFALAPTPDGKLAVGGAFTHAYDSPTAQETEVNHITIWDPQAKRFAALAGGISESGIASFPRVNDIVFGGNDMYIGGFFEEAGGVVTNHIARWDGTKWNALASGMNSTVGTLAFHNNILYAGGLFGGASGKAAHRIARWDGATWTGLLKTNSNENDISGVAVTENGTLYAAGDMERFDDLYAFNIASWTEQEQTWRPLGYGFSSAGILGSINTLAVDGGGRIYAGGRFSYAGGNRIDNLAVWDPTRRVWEAVGGGVDDNVNVLALRGDLLYVGGNFQNVGGANAISAPHIATYNLTTKQWSALAGGSAGGGINSSVTTLAFAPDGVAYVGGNFTTAGTGEADKFAIWNPTNRTWSALPFEFNPRTTAFSNPRVITILPDANGAYIGGDFFYVQFGEQRTDVNSLIYWERATNKVLKFGNGVTQNINGNDIKGTVSALSFGPDGALYVGGNFDKVGDGVAANNIAKLTQQGWAALGAGVAIPNPDTPFVADFAWVGSRLFVAGEFSTAGNANSSHAAIWNTDTSSWEALGDGLRGGEIDSEANVVVTGPAGIYYGGEFITAGGKPSASIAVWGFIPPGVTLDKRVNVPFVRK